MCTDFTPMIQAGEKHLKQVTCELIAEAKKTNALLENLVYGRSKSAGTDEQAFFNYWHQVPLRDFGGRPNEEVARRAWDAALQWERGRIK